MQGDSTLERQYSRGGTLLSSGAQRGPRKIPKLAALERAVIISGEVVAIAYRRGIIWDDGPERVG